MKLPYSSKRQTQGLWLSIFQHHSSTKKQFHLSEAAQYPALEKLMRSGLVWRIRDSYDLDQKCLLKGSSIQK